MRIEAIVAILLLLWGAFPLHSGENAIFVRVTTKEGIPLPGITVRVESGKAPARRLATSLSGMARFPGLPSGRYRVRVEDNAFPQWEFLVDACCGRTIDLPVVLTPGHRQDLTVTIGPAMLDRRVGGTRSCWRPGRPGLPPRSG